MRPRLPSQGGLLPASIHTATAKTDVTSPLAISSTQQYRAIRARISAGWLRTAINAPAQAIHRTGSTKAAARSPHLHGEGISPASRPDTSTDNGLPVARSSSEITIFVTPHPFRQTPQADAEKSISFYAFPFRQTSPRLAECPDESNQKYKHTSVIPLTLTPRRPFPFFAATMSALRISVAAALASLIFLGNASSEDKASAPDGFANDFRKITAMVNAADMPTQKAGFSRLQDAAMEGYLPAINAVASCYLAGQGTPEDRDMAERWAIIGANRGFAPAQNTLALIQMAQVPASQDAIFKAYRNFSLAACVGLPEARYFLARLLLAPGFAQHDSDLGLQWMLLAASNGYPRAAWDVGQIYTDGIIVGKDDIEALAWYRVAADGQIPAARELLKKYEGAKNLPKLMASDKRYFEISKKIAKTKDWSPIFGSENLLANESGMSPLAAKAITSPFFRDKITAIPDAQPLVPASFWETSLGSSWRDAVGRFPRAEPFTYEGDKIPPVFADTPLADLGWKSSTNKFVVLRFSKGLLDSTAIIFHHPSSQYTNALIKEISRTLGYTPPYAISPNDRSTGSDKFVTPISWEPAQSPGTIYVLDTSDQNKAVLTKRRK